MFSNKTGIGISMLLDPLTKEEFRGRLIAFADEERAKDENVFINNLFGTILPGENVVIDDMRLLPELVKVVRAGGKPIRIEAFKQAREERGFKYDRAIDEHISETDLDLCGHTYETLGGARIFNNKSKDHLRAELTELVKKEFVNIQFLQGVTA
jgi:phosphomevalonate kinase